MNNGEGRYERPDNAAILQRRYGDTAGKKPGLAAGRVVLNPHAFLKGWLVTFGVVFAGLAAATTVLVLPGTGSTLPAILAAVIGISAGVGRAAIIRNVNP